MQYFWMFPITISALSSLFASLGNVSITYKLTIAIKFFFLLQRGLFLIGSPLNSSHSLMCPGESGLAG